MKLLITVLFFVCASLFAAAAPVDPHQDIPIGMLPLESVNATVRKVLSPQGRYVILTSTATVRVFDTPAKMQEARLALAALQNTPSLVAFEIGIRAGMHPVVRQEPEMPSHSYDFPYPQHYDPPRILLLPGGGTIVIPAQPRDFTTRRVEPGAVVNLGPVGFLTRDPEVHKTFSSMEGGVLRKYKATATTGKPLALTVSGRVADIGALRELARKHGALAATEPEWVAAGTELLVTPEMSNAGLALQIVPQIVAYTGEGGRTVRRIPIPALAAGALVKRDATVSLDGFPGADAEFYRVFFGAKDSVEGTSASLTVSARVQAQP